MASPSPSSDAAAWCLGNNAKFMGWLSAQYAELARPRNYEPNVDRCPDLRVLFIALMPYEYQRYKKDVAALLSGFSGFQAENVLHFRTMLLFAKLKCSEISIATLDELCAYFGVETESDKTEQIDKFINLIGRPQNLGLPHQQHELLLNISRIDNVKIPGSRRSLKQKEFPPTPSAVRDQVRRKSSAKKKQVDQVSQESNQKSDASCADTPVLTKSGRETSPRSDASGADTPVLTKSGRETSPKASKTSQSANCFDSESTPKSSKPSRSENRSQPRPNPESSEKSRSEQCSEPKSTPKSSSRPPSEDASRSAPASKRSRVENGSVKSETQNVTTSSKRRKTKHSSNGADTPSMNEEQLGSLVHGNADSLSPHNERGGENRSRPDKIKRQLRSTIATYLGKVTKDVTMRMVKEHLRQHFTLDDLLQHKAFIKATVIEVIENL